MGASSRLSRSLRGRRTGAWWRWLGGRARERAGRRSVQWRQGRHRIALAAGTATNIQLLFISFPSLAAPLSRNRKKPGVSPEPPASPSP